MKPFALALGGLLAVGGLAAPARAQVRTPPDSQQRTDDQSSQPQRPRSRGRVGEAIGGGGGPTTAPTAGAVDETPAVTHHKIDVGGKTIAYTATAAQMPLKDPEGETEAHVFYVAYTQDNPGDLSKRAVTFCFNGGPGSASLWVHMGGMGPRQPLLMDDGDMPPPPFHLVDNPDTWLDQTDLVFIDAVGTGYSRAKNNDVARRMNGVQGDIDAFAEFIRMYITRNDRWASPLFLAGESYGTFRAAGLAGRMASKGIAFNGITLIGTILNYGSSRGNLMNGLPNALILPTFTADAFYHKKLPPELSKDLKATLAEAERFAMGDYLAALNMGDALPDEQRRAVIRQVSRYTGLKPEYVDESNLRLDVGHFTRELLRDRRTQIGRYDGRLTGPAPMNAGRWPTSTRPTRWSARRSSRRSCSTSGASCTTRST